MNVKISHLLKLYNSDVPRYNLVLRLYRQFESKKTAFYMQTATLDKNADKILERSWLSMETNAQQEPQENQRFNLPLTSPVFLWVLGFLSQYSTV